MAECICPRTTYLVNGLRDQDKQHIPSGTCSDCGEGLDCALGSDFRNFEDFASGLSEPDPLQENPFPVVEAGYFAKIGALTQVYKCGRPEYCPGGLPGSCVKGRIGLLCGHCTAGQKWTGEECDARLNSSGDGREPSSGWALMGVSIPGPIGWVDRLGRCPPSRWVGTPARVPCLELHTQSGPSDSQEGFQWMAPARPQL